MKKRYFILSMCLLVLLFSSVGCGKKEAEKKDITKTQTESEAKEVKSAVLYIGKEEDYGKYYLLYTGRLTPDKILTGLSDTTGWDLSLDKKITKKKDGYILCFSEKSVFYTGQTLTEEDEFYIPTQEDFYVTVLDSIMKNFSTYFKIDKKAPKLYCWGADDSSLSLSGTGKVIPKGVAYTDDLLKSFEKRRYIGGESAKSYDVEGTFIRMQDEETVLFQVNGNTQIYPVTYTALKAIFKNAQEGRQMRIQITEDTSTGERLITKIY